MNGKLMALMVVAIAVFLVPDRSTYAGGPQNVAFSDRSLWPHDISSSEGFDLSSRAEILAFLQALNRTSIDGFDYSAYVGIKEVNFDSIKKWRASTERLMFGNFKHASGGKSCALFCPDVETPEALMAYADTFDAHLPDNLKPWYENAKVFHSRYVYELLRLAALFPRISSEILTLDDREMTGHTFDDKTFLLTFDDGPSKIHGETDRLIQILRQKNVSALFFLLGSNLESRLKSSSADEVRALYAGMVPASHGKEHKSHATWELWEQSVLSTDALIRQTFGFDAGQVQFFRPPYGQRRDRAAAMLSQHKISVMLWNIDSQDWNRKMSPEHVRDRVVTLMLLWRKGIVLFHDIHEKAAFVVPAIVDTTTKAGVVFRDPAHL